MALDINNATAAELADTINIGSDLANEIISYRDTYGSFNSLDELASVPGVDEELILRLRESGVNLGSVEARGSGEGGGSL